MNVTKMVLSIIALSLAAAAGVCAIIAYWDKLSEFAGASTAKFRTRMAVSEYDDFEE